MSKSFLCLEDDGDHGHINLDAIEDFRFAPETFYVSPHSQPIETHFVKARFMSGKEENFYGEHAVRICTAFGLDDEAEAIRLAREKLLEDERRYKYEMQEYLGRK